METILSVSDLGHRPLTRREAAQWLTERGFRTAEASLAKAATVGGGPTYRKFGRKPLYYVKDLEAYVAGRLSRPRRSTSEVAA
jgi:hypothetical protein